MPLPQALHDPIHTFNLHTIRHISPLTKRLYVHYYYHNNPKNIKPSAPSSSSTCSPLALDTMQSVLATTYQTLMEHDILTTSVVIPPIRQYNNSAPYDPVAYVSDIQTIFQLNNFSYGMRHTISFICYSLFMLIFILQREI